jgi:uncharacterized membrane protein YfcA
MTDLQFRLFLTVVAFCTSLVPGVLGMAGGLILLSALLLKLDPMIAVPVHGLVQLVSNASRAWFLRQHVSWKAVVRFAWPTLGLCLAALLGTAVGTRLLGNLPPALFKLVLRVVISGLALQLLGSGAWDLWRASG